MSNGALFSLILEVVPPSLLLEVIDSPYPNPHGLTMQPQATWKLGTDPTCVDGKRHGVAIHVETRLRPELS